jgi:hypothetical protein
MIWISVLDLVGGTISDANFCKRTDYGREKRISKPSPTDYELGGNELIYERDHLL